MNFSISKYRISAIFVALCLCPLFALADGRVSLLGPAKKIVIDGSNFQSMFVDCSRRKERSYLFKKEGSSVWCITVDSQACSRNKMNAAEKLCSTDLQIEKEREKEATSVANSKNTTERGKAERVRALLEERRQIDDQLLEIQAKRLELHRRELKLLEQSSEL